MQIAPDNARISCIAHRPFLVNRAQPILDLGHFILPSIPPSRQARARSAVQEALTNLALKQSIRSS